MKTFVLMITLATAGFVAGCGQGGNETAAVRASVPKEVTKWKHHPRTAIGSQKGIVIEMEGEKIASAKLYDLKDGDGFAIYSTIGKGVYQAEKGLIIFSNTGTLQLTAAETGQVNDAIRWEVPFSRTATNLVATFWLDGRNMGTLDFQAFKE